LETLEAERRRVRRRRNRTAAIGGGVTAVLTVAAGVGAFPDDNCWIAPLLVALVGGLVTWWRAARRAEGYAERFRAVVIPAIAEFLGLAYDADGGGGPDPAEFERLGLVRRHDRRHLDHGLSGRYRGCDLRFVAARLVRKGSDSNRAWRGLLLDVTAPQPAPTPIFIGADYGAFGNALAQGLGGQDGRTMAEVPVADPAFAERFDLHAGDPEAARQYLDGGFLKAVAAIADAHDPDRRGQVAAAFVGDRFLVSIETPGQPFLNLPGPDVPIAEIEPRLHALIARLALPLDLVDRLHGEGGDA
jgi:hypothetical protein